jgi:hypothetical protein
VTGNPDARSEEMRFIGAVHGAGERREPVLENRDIGAMAMALTSG